MEKMTEIIVRVLKGEASPSDKQTLITWLNESLENKKNFQQMESVWNAISLIDKSREFDHENAFLKFREEVESKLKATRKARLVKITDNILRVAAVAVLILGIGYLIMPKSGKPVTSEITQCEIVSPRGSKTQVILPDNSKVWLNSESKLSYNNEYGQTDREVFLEGEGYFEVESDPARVFVVNTSDIRVKALGTTFNVKSYPDENTIETTLIEGKVDLENIASGKPAKLVSLEPNYKVTYFKDNAETEEHARTTAPVRPAAKPASAGKLASVISTENVDASLVTSWKNNILFFDNETFEDLAVRLERRFDVNIHFIDEETKTMRFTGKFSDIIIEQVLAALQFASPFHYQLNDKDIYISDKPIKGIPASKDTPL